jgi:hypothetical protein
VDRESCFANPSKSKMKSVSKERPAILCVYLSGEWESGAPNTELHVEDAVNKFFSDSKRYNAIVFLWERCFWLLNTPVAHLGGQTFYHPQPRHSIEPSLLSVFVVNPFTPSALYELSIVDLPCAFSALTQRASEYEPSFLSWHKIRGRLLGSQFTD